MKKSSHAEIPGVDQQGPVLLDQMGELGIAAPFRASAIFRGDRMRQKVGMQIMGEEDRQFSGRSCPGICASGKQQGQEAGKNNEHCFCEPRQDPVHFQDGAS